MTNLGVYGAHCSRTRAIHVGLDRRQLQVVARPLRWRPHLKAGPAICILLQHISLGKARRSHQRAALRPAMLIHSGRWLSAGRPESHIGVLVFELRASTRDRRS